jgi:nucleoside 2-deoxyribosyltransferase
MSDGSTASGAAQLIFVAGPMFTDFERDEQQALTDLLEAAGYQVYVAHRDGFEMLRLIEVMEDPALQSDLLYMASLMVQKIGWCLEIAKIHECDGLLLNMNGRVPDEGAVMEASMAFTAGKAIVNYKDSSVTMWGIFDNPMVAALDGTWQPVRSRDQIVAAMQAALAAAPAASTVAPYQYAPPQYLQEVIDLGHFVEANKDALQQALLNATVDITKSLATLAPLLTNSATLAQVKAFLDALLAGGPPPAPASTDILVKPWPPRSAPA